MLPVLSPEDTGLFRWGVCICRYKVIYANATNADRVLPAQSDCVAGGLQPEADMMKSEVSANTPRRQVLKGYWPTQGVIVPQD